MAFDIEAGSFAVFNEDYAPQIFAPDGSDTGNFVDNGQSENRGARFPSGIFGTIGTDGNLVLNQANCDEITTVLVASSNRRRITGGLAFIYTVVDTDFFGTIQFNSYNEAGVVDKNLSSIGQPPGASILFMGVNNDTILYFVDGSDTLTIKRFDLTTDTPLSSLVTHPSSFECQALLVHPNGTIVASWYDGGLDQTTFIHYADDGSILHTSSAVSGLCNLMSLNYDYDAPTIDTQFWATANGSGVHFEYGPSTGITAILTQSPPGGAANQYFLMIGAGIVVTSNPLSGIYQLIPGSDRDKYYTLLPSLDETAKKIPEPFATTFLLGDE